MCNPTAFTALRVFSAVQSYQADKAQARSVNETATANARNIREEAIYKDNALIRQKENKEDQLINQKVKLKQLETQKKGQVKLQIFEKNIGGNLFNSLVGDVERQAGKDSSIIDQNYENYMYGMASDRLAWNRRFTNQINNLPRAYKPSFTSYALSAATDIGTMYMSNSAPKTPDSIDYDYYETGEHY